MSGAGGTERAVDGSSERTHLASTCTPLAPTGKPAVPAEILALALPPPAARSLELPPGADAPEAAAALEVGGGGGGESVRAGPGRSDALAEILPSDVPGLVPAAARDANADGSISSARGGDLGAPAAPASSKKRKAHAPTGVKNAMSALTCFIKTKFAQDFAAASNTAKKFHWIKDKKAAQDAYNALDEEARAPYLAMASEDQKRAVLERAQARARMPEHADKLAAAPRGDADAGGQPSAAAVVATGAPAAKKRKLRVSQQEKADAQVAEVVNGLVEGVIGQSKLEALGVNPLTEDRLPSAAPELASVDLAAVGERMNQMLLELLPRAYARHLGMKGDGRSSRTCRLIFRQEVREHFAPESPKIVEFSNEFNIRSSVVCALVLRCQIEVFDANYPLLVAEERVLGRQCTPLERTVGVAFDPDESFDLADRAAIRRVGGWALFAVDARLDKGEGGSAREELILFFKACAVTRGTDVHNAETEMLNMVDRSRVVKLTRCRQELVDFCVLLEERARVKLAGVLIQPGELQACTTMLLCDQALSSKWRQLVTACASWQSSEVLGFARRMYVRQYLNSFYNSFRKYVARKLKDAREKQLKAKRAAAAKRKKKTQKKKKPSTSGSALESLKGSLRGKLRKATQQRTRPTSARSARDGDDDDDTDSDASMMDAEDGGDADAES